MQKCLNETVLGQMPFRRERGAQTRSGAQLDRGDYRPAKYNTLQEPHKMEEVGVVVTGSCACGDL